MITDEDIKNKLLILFILDKYEIAMKQEILCTMCCIDNNWIPYFCFSQFIEELHAVRFVNVAPDKSDPDDRLLSITEDGKICLSYFYNNIFRSLRDEVSAFIRDNKLKYRRQQEFLCEIQEKADKTCTVHCRVFNGQQILFELSFDVPNKRKAETVSAKWQESAPEVYKNYVDLLID